MRLRRAEWAANAAAWDGARDSPPFLPDISNPPVLTMNPQRSGTNQRQDLQPGFSLSEIGIADRDLRIEMFALCDCAIEQQGRLSLLGTYEAIHVPSFPTLLPQATVVLRVRFWPAENREQSFRFMLSGADGQPIGELIEANAALRPFCGDRSAAYNLIFQLQDLQFEQPGEHSLDFYLNGKLEGRLPLCVLHAPMAPCGL